MGTRDWPPTPPICLETHVMVPEQEDYSRECECRIPYRFTCDSYEKLENLYYAQGSNDKWKKEDMPTDGIDKRRDKWKSNLHSEDDFDVKIKNLDPRLQKLLKNYEEVFAALPPPGSCKKLVEMDLKLKPEFEEQRLKRMPYLDSADHVEEIERQVQECIDAGLVLEYRKKEYPSHCSPCLLVAEPGSTALRLVVDYDELNKRTQNHFGSLPNKEHTLERISSYVYKTNMEKRSGFWQVDPTAAAQELLAFITSKGRVFKWMFMPFGVANAPSVIQ